MSRKRGQLSKNCSKLQAPLATALAIINTSLLIHRANDGPELSINHITRMAWRPYENLIDGELDNTIPGKVTGWIRFFRYGNEPLKVSLELLGDFRDDIRGKVIHISNPSPSDYEETPEVEGTYMEGFDVMQRGTAGDITAGLPVGPWTDEIAKRLLAQHELRWDKLGVRETEREECRKELNKLYRDHIDNGDLFYSYSAYPYIEWYSDANGRVVLELDPSQVEVVNGVAPVEEKTAAELVQDEDTRMHALVTFMSRMVKHFSRENRDNGGDGKVFGAVIGD